MDQTSIQSYTAFDGHKLLTQGPLEDVVLKIKRHVKSNPNSNLLVFSDSSGKQMDFDLHGTEKEVLQKLKIYLVPELSSPALVGPGRPKLGVVAREISLLPRHWEWLSTQSGGASATIRRLVDDAKKSSTGKDLVKQAQERTYKFMSAIAGDLPRYEEALRALYKKDKALFKSQIADWPTDVKDYTKNLSADVFAS